jgi:hypothetical protein
MMLMQLRLHSWLVCIKPEKQEFTKMLLCNSHAYSLSLCAHRPQSGLEEWGGGCAQLLRKSNPLGRFCVAVKVDLGLCVIKTLEKCNRFGWRERTWLISSRYFRTSSTHDSAMFLSVLFYVVYCRSLRAQRTSKRAFLDYIKDTNSGTY